MKTTKLSGGSAKPSSELIPWKTYGENQSFGLMGNSFTHTMPVLTEREISLSRNGFRPEELPNSPEFKAHQFAKIAGKLLTSSNSWPQATLDPNLNRLLKKSAEAQIKKRGCGRLDREKTSAIFSNGGVINRFRHIPLHCHHREFVLAFHDRHPNPTQFLIEKIVRQTHRRTNGCAQLPL